MPSSLFIVRVTSNSEWPYQCDLQAKIISLNKLIVVVFQHKHEDACF
jgi:hypothetical protein